MTIPWKLQLLSLFVALSFVVVSAATNPHHVFAQVPADTRVTKVAEKAGVLVQTVRIESANTDGLINLAVAVPANSSIVGWSYWVKDDAWGGGTFVQCQNPDNSCPIGWSVWSSGAPTRFTEDNGTTLVIQTAFANSSHSPRRCRFEVKYQ